MELRDGGQHSTVQHYITPQQHHTQSACMPACFQENREALTLWYRLLRIDKPPGLTHFSKQGLYTLHTRLDKHTRPQSHLTHKHTRSQACTYQKHTSVRLAALQSMRTSMHLTNLHGHCPAVNRNKEGRPEPISWWGWSGGKWEQWRSMLRSSRACNVDQSSRKWTKSCSLACCPNPALFTGLMELLWKQVMGCSLIVCAPSRLIKLISIHKQAARSCREKTVLTDWSSLACN